MFQLVTKSIKEVIEEKGPPLPKVLVEDLPLAELGLESLDWAVVFIKLEDHLGVDPFAVADADYDVPTTIRELVDLYDEAVTRQAKSV